MANTNETEPTNNNSGGTTSTNTTYTATPFQIGLGLMLVGASAGTYVSCDSTKIYLQPQQDAAPPLLGTHSPYLYLFI